MHPAVRNTLAVIVGVVVAFSLVAIVEAIGHAVYPLPEGIDFSKPEQLRTLLQGMPTGALVFVLVAWTVATFGGGLVAALIARTKPMLYAGIVGAFVLAATIMNLVMIPHPMWFAIVGIVGVVLGAFVAGKVAGGRAVPQ